MRLAELADHIGAELRSAAGGADGDTRIARCARLDEAGADAVAFLANPKYLQQLASSNAAAVIVAPDAAEDGRTLLVADDPYYAFRNAAVALHGFGDLEPPADRRADEQTPHASIRRASEEGRLSPRAVVDPEARLGEQTIVHPYAVIGRDARIGDRCAIHPHTFIGAETTIGDDCVLHPSVTVYQRCVIGDRVTLHAGCVVGQDGFGYATHEGRHHKIPHVGNAVIENDVEMGAGCAIDRATLGSTVIGEGSKFSDLIAIGHGTRVGRHNLLVAMVGLAGSVETGDHVVMGGQAGVAGHLRIGDRVQIAATSGVMNDVPNDTKVGGAPAQPLHEAKRIHLSVQRLPELVSRVKELERKLRKLEDE